MSSFPPPRLMIPLLFETTEAAGDEPFVDLMIKSPELVEMLLFSTIDGAFKVSDLPSKGAPAMMIPLVRLICVVATRITFELAEAIFAGSI